MKKYKSLLYREWKLSSKHYIVRLGLFMLFALMLGFICMLLEGSNSMEMIMIYIGAALAAALISEDNGVFASDVNSNWVQYSYALPVTAFDRAVTRYIFKLITMVVGMMLTIGWAAGLCACNATSISMNMIMNFFLILDVTLVFDMLVEALVLRAGTVDEMKKMKVIAWGVLIGVISVVANFLPTGQLDEASILLEKKMAENGSPEEVIALFDTLLAPIADSINSINFLAIPLVIVFLVIGFILARKNFERRGA